MSYRIETYGLEKIKSLKSLAAALKGYVDEALNQAAQLCVAEAKRFAPVRTGRLRDSIRILEKGEGYVTVGSDVEYAPHVEFGTYRMAPRSFLRPAIWDAVYTFQEMIKVRVERVG